ncbi:MULTISPECIES: hypothetical protein [Rhodococcus]|nr:MULTISPECIES: hypothetical protein [Rhodococcus]KAF0957562.1 hypothetical protein MLGJGCBP_09394 [Rhodococcus sp. T7]KAF0963737.1 hypothetical protein MLGJGCBP_03133 [Rhodococcus sp. T7]UUK33962.1 hypothetical protein MPY17_40535 [Rhodococcus opacus]
MNNKAQLLLLLAGAVGGTAVLQAVLGRTGTRRTRGAPFHPNG